MRRGLTQSLQRSNRGFHSLQLGSQVADGMREIHFAVAPNAGEPSVRMPAKYMDAKPRLLPPKAGAESSTQFVHPRTGYHGETPCLKVKRYLTIPELQASRGVNQNSP